MSSLIQWNCNPELKLMMAEQAPICVYLQETHLKPEENFSLRGFDIFRKDVEPDQRAREGVATIIKSQSLAKQITLQTDLQAVAI